MPTQDPKVTGRVIAWPGGAPKDRVAAPTDPRVLSVLAEYNMTVKVGDDNCYEVVNEAGDVLEVPFGTLLNEWGPLIRWFARRTPCQN